MTQGKKYIVVDTWNGEGYSSDNGVEMKLFETKKEANAYCKLMAYRNEGANINISTVENGYEYEDTDEEGCHDSGSYRYYQLQENSYAVEILCNINEVVILNQVEFSKALAERESDIVEADVYRGDHAFNTDDGIFYHCVDQYDFQYRRISSLL